MNRKESDQIKKRIAVYNMIPNILWSVIFLSPISVFCYSNMRMKIFFIFLAISILTIFLPKNILIFFQLGKTASLYKKAGVAYINKFTQNGDIINRILRKKYPGYSIIAKENFSTNKILQQTYMFEKFHFILFSFFILTAAYAVFQQFYWWAFFITITNVIYNIYPILLQQYIRIRLSSLKKRDSLKNRQ